MTTTTPTRLADIEIETKKDWDAVAPVAGRTYSSQDAPLLAQPAGVRLDNDGCYHNWLEVGATWELRWDGIGWRATSEAWPTSREHIMRLADATGPHGAYVGALPTAAGDFVLEQGVTYSLRLGADLGATRTVAILSIIEE